MTVYNIVVAETMPELIILVTALLATQTPLGAPFINRQSQWCQAMTL